MDELREKLLKANVDGNFFEFIQGIYYEDRRGEKLLPSLLVELHNEGLLNLVELFSSFKNKTENYDFFSVRHVFEEVLPDINAVHVSVADQAPLGEENVESVEAILYTKSPFCLEFE